MRAMMKIWVSGASGQVGTAITDVADPLAFELLNTRCGRIRYYRD